MAGSQTNLSYGIDAVSGMRKYPPVSLGGPVTGRSPIIDSGDSSLAKNVMYVADNDGLVYGDRYRYGANLVGGESNDV